MLGVHKVPERLKEEGGLGSGWKKLKCEYHLIFYHCLAALAALYLTLVSDSLTD